MTESDYDIIMFGGFFLLNTILELCLSAHHWCYMVGRKKHKFTQLQQIKPVYRDRLFPLASIRVTYVTHCATRTKKRPILWVSRYTASHARNLTIQKRTTMKPQGCVICQGEVWVEKLHVLFKGAFYSLKVLKRPLWKSLTRTHFRMLTTYHMTAGQTVGTTEGE